MAKVALLIAVSEYEPGLNSLPGTTNDVEAMRQVLHNPEIGGFDEVKILINPQQHEMAVAIEILFDSRQKDDLVLLFFSGHGIKDEGGRLYFAARNTRKNLQGRLFETTAVAASSVHRFMTTSRSKHQVVILDCCFSGAFAEGMLARDDGFVDVKNQLGGEGRAVLTSSTSTQFSFEQQGADTSTYTYYIVDGLKTGAADRDEDGWISVDELHEYAKSKVQEVAPAMKPEIYAIREGFKILLAKAPSDNPQLIYRREVEYLTSASDGRISDAGRDVLDELRHHLGLTSEEIAAIEDKVLEPYREYQRKLKLYEQRFIKEIQREYPINDKTREQLKRFQKVLGFIDENIALIEAPIIAEQLSTLPPPPTPRRRNNNFPSYIVIGACIIGLIGVVIGGTVVYFITRNPSQPEDPSPVKLCADNKQYNLGDSISLGEEILVKEDTNPDKEAGVKAFAKGDCQTAIDKFNSYRQVNLTDPEALIYLNNAKARQQGKWLKIAVSVPTSTDIGLAKEILRGVAQAQDEVNNKNGINGKLLQVTIANDDEKLGTATKIANALVEDQEVLGVVGAASSNATLEAGKVYTTNRLIAISPTSTSVNISNFSPYVFRTVFSDKVAAEELANYMIKNLQENKAAVFFNSSNLYSRSLKEEFVTAVQKKGGQVLQKNQFDFNSYNLDAETAVKEAISQNVKVLMLISDSEILEKAYKVIQANDRKLYIFGGDYIFNPNTLKSWGKQAEGMVIAVPWYIGNASNSNFVNNSKKLWKATVNWRTATSYDATLTIITGLQQSNTREELQNTLHRGDFSVDGATGKFRFSKSGDRTNNPIFLVKVQQKTGTDEYDFVPIKP